jgi:hypothetical protein
MDGAKQPSDETTDKYLQEKPIKEMKSRLLFQMVLVRYDVNDAINMFQKNWRHTKDQRHSETARAAPARAPATVREFQQGLDQQHHQFLRMQDLSHVAKLQKYQMQ